MQLCKDCKWVERFRGGPDSCSRCHHPEIGVMHTDPVTGDRRYWYCAAVRRDDVLKDCPGFELYEPLIQITEPEPEPVEEIVPDRSLREKIGDFLMRIFD